MREGAMNRTQSKANGGVVAQEFKGRDDPGVSFRGMRFTFTEDAYTLQAWVFNSGRSGWQAASDRTICR